MKIYITMAHAAKDFTKYALWQAAPTPILVSGATCWKGASDTLIGVIRETTCKALGLPVPKEAQCIDTFMDFPNMIHLLIDETSKLQYDLLSLVCPDFQNWLNQ